jgi:hypothetical protein
MPVWYALNAVGSENQHPDNRRKGANGNAPDRTNQHPDARPMHRCAAIDTRQTAQANPGHVAALRGGRPVTPNSADVVGESAVTAPALER